MHESKFYRRLFREHLTSRRKYDILNVVESGCLSNMAGNISVDYRYALVAKGVVGERSRTAIENLYDEYLMKTRIANQLRIWKMMFIGGLLWIGGTASTASAITVYFADGITLEVDQITKMGNTVYLTLDLSRIDTSRTPIQDLDALESSQTRVIQQAGLSIANFNITPTEDNTELVISGDVANNAEFAVKDVRVNVTLQDQQGQKLLTVKGYVRPEKLAVGKTGTFSLQIRRPENFWKASADVQATPAL